MGDSNSSEEKHMLNSTRGIWQQRRMAFRFAAVVALAMAASACGSSSEPTPRSTASAAAAPATTAATSIPAPATTVSSIAKELFATIPDVEYSSGRELDVHVPAGAKRAPVVVVVHGLGQSRREFTDLAEALATEGAVVFNISVTFSVPPLDAIEDIACAVRVARATAPEYGGDPMSITLVGNSSGAAKGSIVAMDGDAYEGDCVITEGSALPDVLVGYEGPYDYATHLYGGFTVPALQDDDHAMWEAVNPYSHIGGNEDLVVRLIHGRDSDVGQYDVLPEVSAEFHRVLAEAGYDVELTYVDGASHGALRPGTEAFDVTVVQVLEAAMDQL